MSLNIPDESTLLVIVAANRYYLWRVNADVSHWCDFLVAIWPALPAEVHAVIKMDVGDCDRAAWERVRALWT